MNFKIYKKFVVDNQNIKYLSIRVEHNLNKDKWRDRYLLFDETTATFKKHCTK